VLVQAVPYRMLEARSACLARFDTEPAGTPLASTLSMGCRVRACAAVLLTSVFAACGGETNTYVTLPSEQVDPSDAPEVADSVPETAPVVSSSSAQAGCAAYAGQCWGLPCCEGAGECLPTPTSYGTTYACGGVAPGGHDEVCSSSDSVGCSWLELAGCRSFGAIAEFCPSNTSVRQLRRCDGSCFVPDELYQSFTLCSCDGRAAPGTAACCTSGVHWAAVLCCS
jgi:hypothetical protein